MKFPSTIRRIAVVAALAMSLAAPAHAGYAIQQARGRLLDLGVYDRDSRQTLPVYWRAGRYYVAGVPGHRYQISLRNHSGEDVLVVPSVDGVNAYTGDTADWSQGGYVLDGYASYDIKGWRKSLSQVAGFVFADAARSYAARTGRPDNVGVIGVAVFRRRVEVAAAAPIERERYAEEQVERAPLSMRRYAPPAPMPAMPAMPAPQAAPAAIDNATTAPTRAEPEAGFADASIAKTSGPLGTGFGRREHDDVQLVDFERASREPDEVITIYYDTYANLLARGVLPPRLPRPYPPQPFPGQFVPDPPGG